MKKSIKLGLIALIGLTLSSCSLLEGVLGSSGLGGLIGPPQTWHRVKRFAPPYRTRMPTV